MALLLDCYEGDCLKLKGDDDNECYLNDNAEMGYNPILFLSIYPRSRIDIFHCAQTRSVQTRALQICFPRSQHVAPNDCDY